MQCQGLCEVCASILFLGRARHAGCLQVLKQLSGAKALKATAKSKVHSADARAFAKVQEELEQGRTQKWLLPFEIMAFFSPTVPEVTSPPGTYLPKDEEL